tara:strand:- start:28216 stop:31674 length:3459 start_codon:yes stop_codon:yes gene_type:complete
MKLLVKTLIASLLLILILLALMFSLVSTERGTQWVLNFVTEHVNQSLSLKEVSGTLASSLKIRELSLDHCASHVTLNELSFEWSPEELIQRKLTIQNLSAQSILVHVNDKCPKSAETPFDIPAAINVPVELNLNQLSIMKVTVVKGEDEYVLNNIKLDASADEQDFHLNLVDLNYDDLFLKGELTSKMHQPYSLNGNLHWLLNNSHDSYQGDVNYEGDITQLLIKHQLNNPYKVNSTVEIFDPLDNLTFNALNQWDSIALNLSKDEKITIHQGSIVLDGNLDQLTYSLDTRIDTAYADNLSLTGKGSATSSSVVLEKLNLKHHDANVSAAGNIALLDNVEVMLNITAQHFDPSLIDQRYPGEINADMDFMYTNKNNMHGINVDIKKLHGDIRSYKITGSGQISSNVETINFDDIKISLGENTLQAKGTLSEKFDLTANINAPRLDEIILDASGDLAGKVHLKGTRDNPAVELELSSKSLVYGQEIIASGTHLQASTNNLFTENISLSADINALKVNENDIQNLRVTFEGDLADHEIESSLDSSPGTVILKSKGTYNADDEVWRGELSKLELGNTSYGDWQINSPTKLMFGNQKADVEPLCLMQGNQRLCVTYNQNNTLKVLEARLEDLELSHFQSQINDFGEIQGKLNGTVDLTGNAQNQWTGKVYMGSRDLSFKPASDVGFDEEITFDLVEYSMNIEEQSRIDLTFSSNYGQGSSNFIVSSLLSPQQANIDKGEVSLNLPDLVFLNAFVKSAVIKNGQGNIDLDIEGPLVDPKIIAQSNIHSLDFYLPDLGTEYLDTQLHLKTDNLTRLNLQGKINSSKGSMDVSGWFSLDDIKNPEYEIFIKGDNFQVVDTLDIKAAISPDLSLKGTQSSLSINGNVDVPLLNVILKELPENIDAVSKDEIIIDDKDDTGRNNKFNLSANIMLTLGENVLFTGYGLQSELQGRIKITHDDHKSTVGHGVLSMHNARYNKFGQTLDVNKGKIIFSGPIDDPSLDIEINRSNSDLSVTMLITGKAKEPQTKLISNPFLSEADKLSFLLTGRQLNQLNSSEGSSLSNAALALGIGQSSPLIQEIGTKFGLDTLSVGAGDDGLQSTSLLLGKHLSPRIYVTYAKDLFSALGAIQINYLLTKHFSIEVESGNQQTVDLIYSITRD